MSDVEKYMLVHGHDLVMSQYQVDNKLLDYMLQLETLNLQDSYNINSRVLSKKEMMSGVKQFLSNLRFHNISYIEENELIEMINNLNVSDIDNLCNYYNKLGKNISPYDLPIMYKNKDNFYGLTVHQTLYIEDYDILFKQSPKFQRIELSNIINNITTSCYIHELIHTQLESNKGVMIDYKNSETLSIFFELLYAYKNSKDDYILMLINRIGALYSSLDSMAAYYDNKIGDFEYLSNCKYLVSILESFNLLNLYLNSTDSIKKEIIKSIQEVFDYNDTLDNMLFNLEITYENSEDINILKKLLSN